MMVEPGQSATEKNLDSFLDAARKNLLADLIDGQKWDYHPHLGTHFLSQYSLCLKWLGIPETDVDDKIITRMITETQLPDGSWQQLKDVNLKSGELNATVFNYWFLKSTGHDVNGSKLLKAREFILSRGGLESSTLFTKTFLALFNQYPWQKLSKIPYLLFVESLPSNYRNFSQWLIPHLMPMAYLRAKRVTKDLGLNFEVSELWKKRPNILKLEQKKGNYYADLPLISKILGRQQGRGSWGGYTVSTLLSVMSLQHFNLTKILDREQVELAVRKGLLFIEQLYVQSGSGSYRGCLMDGHYWDSVLCANAFLDSGGNSQEILKVRNYILASQQLNGGFPYGYDFEYAPDVDDTAEVVRLLSRFQDQKINLKKATDWLLTMQNDDGGWGAFDRDNVGNPVLRILTKPFRNSADLFDDSSADSTGHVIEALSASGLNINNSKACKKAARYLKKTQSQKLGAWTGRWAVNYLFGTSCALVGLAKIGVSATEPFIERALGFLLNSQNDDGGYGESTDSYLDPKQVARGLSTPSQTAWVLTALCHFEKQGLPQAQKAVAYLTKFKQAQWSDESVTGTGHPGVLYMNYPSYAKAFPLSALGIYRNKIRN